MFARKKALSIDLLLLKGKLDRLNFIKMNIESFEFEGNLKNFYASLKSGAKIKFSVPNAIDTSSITSGSSIVLGFESSKSVILPKASLAID